MTKPFIELFHAWELHLSGIFIDLHPSINGYIASRIFGFLMIFVFICYRLFYEFQEMTNSQLEIIEGDYYLPPVMANATVEIVIII